MVAEGRHRGFQTFGQGDPSPPAQCSQLAHIELLFRGAVGLAGVPADLAAEARGSRHSFSQLADRQIHPRAHIEVLDVIGAGLPVLQGKHAGLAQIIHMQNSRSGVPVPQQVTEGALASTASQKRRQLGKKVDAQFLI